MKDCLKHFIDTYGYWHKQEDENAISFLTQAEDIFKQTADVRNHALAANHLGIVYRSVGLFKEALAHLIDAEKTYRKLNDRKGLGKCLNSIGTCEWWQGNPTAAASRYAEANQINTALDNQYVLGLTANDMGYLYLEQNQPQKALDAFLLG